MNHVSSNERKLIMAGFLAFTKEKLINHIVEVDVE